jgi:hypothetical protein
VPVSVGFGFPHSNHRRVRCKHPTVDTPTAGHCGTIFVAIELSQRNWLVTLHCPDRDKISRHRLGSGDHAGLLALIDRVRERAAPGVGTGAGGGELLRGRL